MRICKLSNRQRTAQRPVTFEHQLRCAVVQMHSSHYLTTGPDVLVQPSNAFAKLFFIPFLTAHASQTSIRTCIRTMGAYHLLFYDSRAVSLSLRLAWFLRRFLPLK